LRAITYLLAYLLSNLFKFYRNFSNSESYVLLLLHVIQTVHGIRVSKNVVISVERESLASNSLFLEIS